MRNRCETRSRQYCPHSRKFMVVIKMSRQNIFTKFFCCPPQNHSSSAVAVDSLTSLFYENLKPGGIYILCTIFEFNKIKSKRADKKLCWIYTWSSFLNSLRQNLVATLSYYGSSQKVKESWWSVWGEQTNRQFIDWSWFNSLSMYSSGCILFKLLIPSPLCGLGQYLLKWK